MFNFPPPLKIVEPISIKPSKNFLKKNFASRREEILNQIQGEIILLKDNLPLVFLITAFVLGLEVSPAILFQTNKKKFLLYNFLPENQIFPFKINHDLSFSLKTSASPSQFCKIQILNLEKYFLKRENENQILCLSEFIKKLNLNTKFSIITILKGKAPKLAFFLIIRKLINNTGEIWLELPNQKTFRVF